MKVDEKKGQESQKKQEKTELSIQLSQSVVEHLREESHKRRIPIADIISESLNSRYQDKPTQKPVRTTDVQSSQIRRVVLEVLEELGLHKKAGSPRTPKTTPKLKPTTMALRKIVSEPEACEPEIKFTDNNNGTITDNRTGLIWLKDARCLDRTSWEEAMAQVGALASGRCGLDDHSVAGDWRLPSREELESLAEDKRREPALPTDHPFIGVQTSNYWSSSVRDNDTLHAWVVYINRGRVNYNKKTGNYCVWPVRGERKKL